MQIKEFNSKGVLPVLPQQSKTGHLLLRSSKEEAIDWYLFLLLRHSKVCLEATDRFFT